MVEAIVEIDEDAMETYLDGKEVAEDVLHPVEFTGDEIDGAIEWLTEKVGVPIAAHRMDRMI